MGHDFGAELARLDFLEAENARLRAALETKISSKLDEIELRHARTCAKYGWTWRERPDVRTVELVASNGRVMAWIVERPGYCDRGHYGVGVECVPSLDHQDAFPRYFMRLETAKQELVEFLAWRLFKDRSDASDPRPERSELTENPAPLTLAAALAGPPTFYDAGPYKIGSLSFPLSTGSAKYKALHVPCADPEFAKRVVRLLSEEIIPAEPLCAHDRKTLDDRQMNRCLDCGEWVEFSTAKELPLCHCRPGMCDGYWHAQPVQCRREVGRKP